ncbi:conserved exported hypothetical protein [uncultured delta proteobacterium]|uniref:Lipoprotein n=1 Tax=uncultured delta proteobacterium TaxID=34034 RepID=A0A212J5A4_9DELT|nr:conserved exported hypothetical protein [uncultured delta proteobacterium]
MRASLRFFLPHAVRCGALALMLVFLGACARSTDTLRTPADPVVAQTLWSRFTHSAQRAQKADPFRLNATLYYSGKEDSQRVTVYFWGNGENESPLPLRLDILMGPGSVMAAIREDSGGLSIYVPRDKTVYQADEGNLLAFDLPVPFSLADLSALVTGKFADLFAPPEADAEDVIRSAMQGDNGAVVYHLPEAPLPGRVTLDENALPVAWSDGENWTLTIEYWPDSTRTTPRKLYIKHAEGREATLIVRELDHPKPFTVKQLDLTVPQGTRLAPLEVRQ